MNSITYDTRRELSVTEIDTRGRVRESKKKKRRRGCGLAVVVSVSVRVRLCGCVRVTSDAEVR